MTKAILLLLLGIFIASGVTLSIIFKNRKR